MAAARRWYGTTWRHQGRDEHGLDCGGLILVVGWELGLIPREYDPSNYQRVPDGKSLRRWCRGALDVVAREPRPGDVALLEARPGMGWPVHLGILSDLRGGELGLIHAYNARALEGAVRESHWRGWSRRLMGLYSYRGVAD